MRLDLFLKASRLVLRRTLAQDLCDANRVKVNGQTAKPSKEVKIGDAIEIKRSNRVLSVRVLEIPKSKQVSRTLAPSLYEILSEETVGDALRDSALESGDNSASPTT